MGACTADRVIDIAIRGAGPVGCVAALALRGSRHRLAVVDAGGTPSGFRPIALSHASRLILERVGAWQALDATPIETVQVSQAGAFGRTRLESREAGVPALGYVVDYTALAEALRALVSPAPGSAPLEARCTVHAEGFSEGMREKRYGQDAVVGLVELASAARATAFERFTAEGPLALLPIADRYALIWSTTPEQAATLATMPAAQFLARLSASLGPRIGRAVAVERRAVQPLVLRTRAARVHERAVYIGNAAQTLHPVAGQGLNLGLRDAWDLAQFLREAEDPGDARLLARYASVRRIDSFATIGITDFLGGGANAWSVPARAAAMCALDALPPLRRFFARRMIYGPSALP